MKAILTLKGRHKFLIVYLACMTSLTPGALQAQQFTDQPDPSSEYFTLDEGAETESFSEHDETFWIAPAAFVQNAAEGIKRIQASALSLVHWTLHPEAPPTPADNYNRRQQFGGWVNDPADSECYNTRAKVLIRDSLTPVTFKETNHCVVDTGTWRDPYTGNIFTSSKQIQIDHMVPLKHAYLAGGFQWTNSQRCVYANFSAFEGHLISASGTENMRKGDRGPDRYMPPNPAEACHYLSRWLKIKMIWKMILFPNEADSIARQLKDNNCDPDELKITRMDVEKYRQFRENEGACSRF